MNKRIVELLICLSILFLILTFIIVYFKTDKNQISKNELDIETKKNLTQDNIIEGIKYISEDLSGNLYSILAETGVQNPDNVDEIFFSGVSAKLIAKNKTELLIFADSANYNNLNYNTNFKDNVLVIYKNEKINCDYLKLDFYKNTIILSENIVFKNPDIKLLVDKIEIDLTTKTSVFSMNEKSKNILINYTKNGIN